MRLFRALADLLIVFALVASAAAPAQAASFAPAWKFERHGAVEHQSSTSEVEHSAHHDGAPPSKHPVHSQDSCQTLCCSIPTQLPPRGPDTRLIDLFNVVTYAEGFRPAVGRVEAPEPGIPKVI